MSPEPITTQVRTEKPTTTFDLHKLLKIAPVQFDELYELENPTQAEVMELERCATHLAMLASYLEERCDGNDHKGAAKCANKVRHALRKAQGYNSTHDIYF